MAKPLRNAVRTVVRKRAEDHCEICGIALTHAVQTDADFASMHHRYPRRQGGFDSVTCLLQLCQRCHGALHTNETEAVRNGWLCLERTTWLQPIRTHRGWIRLREDGRYEALSSLESEDLDACRGPLPQLLQQQLV